jgi:hypothetical protein
VNTPQQVSSIAAGAALMTVSNSSIGIPRGLAQSVPIAVKSQSVAPDRSPGQSELSWFWLLPMLLVAGWWWRWLMKKSTRDHRSPVAAAKLAPIDPVMPIVDTPVSADLSLAEPLDPDALPPARQQPQPTLRLLAERLMVDLHRYKVGEVIVRKEIETRIVEVPVRREKLIVEQVSPEFKQLAVIDLGQTDDETATLAVDELGFLPPVTAKFTSPSAAIHFLQSIDHRQNTQMNIVIEAADDQWDDDRWLQESHRQTAAIGS